MQLNYRTPHSLISYLIGHRSCPVPWHEANEESSLIVDQQSSGVGTITHGTLPQVLTGS